eukprot:8878394-Pyramimonas_sp.AAC.1
MIGATPALKGTLGHAELQLKSKLAEVINMKLDFWQRPPHVFCAALAYKHEAIPKSVRKAQVAQGLREVDEAVNAGRVGRYIEG